MARTLEHASPSQSLGSAVPADRNATPRMLPALAHAEWRWIAIVTVLLLLATQIPPTVQRLAGPADRVHPGNYWYHTDFSAYRNAMMEGKTSSSWLIHNPASAEEHHPALMFPLYVTLGKIARVTGLSELAVFAAAEDLTRLLLPVTLYLFIATFLADVRQRRLAFILAVFSAGLTLFAVPILDLLGIPTTLGGQPSVQVVTLGLFFTAPHLGLGLVMTLTAMISFAAVCRGALRALLPLGLAVLALALLHPFNLPTVVTTFGVYTLALIFVERRMPPRPVIGCIVAGVAGVPLLLYNFVTFTLDPFWSKTHGEANTLPSPRPWELPMDYGIVFILAVVGTVMILRAHRLVSPSGRDRPEGPSEGATGGFASTSVESDEVAPSPQPSPIGRGSPHGENVPALADVGVLLAWVGTGLLWMYIPLAYQHRLAFGLQPAMAVLAAVGWVPSRDFLRDFFRRFLRLRASTARALATSLLAVLAVSLPLAVFTALSISAATNAPISLYTLDRDTYTVGEWIAARAGPDDVTLGSVNTGEVLSGFLPGRVVIARKAGTINFPEKLEKVEAIYEGRLSVEETLAFLRANRVSYIVVGPEERKLGPNDPGIQLGLPEAVRVGNAVAYHLPADDRPSGG